jgi:hypothetical protein
MSDDFVSYARFTEREAKLITEALPEDIASRSPLGN